MRAYVWSGTGLAMEEVDEPRPREGEVRISVKACGLCQTDLHVMAGKIPFPAPCVLGHEVAGIIDELGPGVTGWEVGDRIVAGFIMPCGACRHCATGRDNQCEPFLTLNRQQGVLFDGTSRLRSDSHGPIAVYSMGGLAEQCVIPVTDVFGLPEEVGFDEAAVLGCSGLTAIGAVCHVGHVGAGDSVAVIGVGGVGLQTVQLARLFGAGPIIAVDLDADKLTMARKLGATHLVHAGVDDVVEGIRAITAGRGVQTCFDVVGTAASLDDAAESVDLGGRIVVVGVGAGNIPAPVNVLSLVRRQLQILGSFGGLTRQDLPQLVRYVAESKIDIDAIITDRYSFDAVPQAIADLEDGKVRGRAVITL